MAITQEHVTSVLTEKLKAVHVDVQDLSGGCGAKFEALIVSPLFEGKRLLERQRLVYSALEDEMKSIHALTMKTKTPTEWQNTAP
eukprot:CAMPEP_0196661202 /NCGR_PEP_ID=MMETSP1086-20130531/43217_1 /TAXON_ID=77921 /ORGANISM="Cyanoptyche  gloeocystis , Strain SAG4.97" /LENGTH=84 /DNA_ID=CAMNT_0041995991 /DNA_START=63 /DNA_END=317 /DNA_ORIENTATION=+